MSRKYAVTTVKNAKEIARSWLSSFDLENAVEFGLPEVDDRYHVWRVPLVKQGGNERVGEVVLDAYNSLVLAEETTKPDVIQMSMSHWPKQLAQLLADKFGYRSKLVSVAPDAAAAYFKKKLKRAQFEDFVCGLTTAWATSSRKKSSGD